MANSGVLPEIVAIQGERRQEVLMLTSEPGALTAVFPISWVRDQFSALHNQPRTVFFDKGAGAQIPQGVLDAVEDHCSAEMCNAAVDYRESAEVDAVLARARESVAAFLNAIASGGSDSTSDRQLGGTADGQSHNFLFRSHYMVIHGLACSVGIASANRFHNVGVFAGGELAVIPDINRGEHDALHLTANVCNGAHQQAVKS